MTILFNSLRGMVIIMNKEDIEREALTYPEEERGNKIHQKANYYKENGDYETAILYYEYFLTLKKDNISFELPELYNKIGAYNKTIAFVNNEWLLNENRAAIITVMPQPLYHLGMAYAAVNDIESAERNLLCGANVQKDRLQSDRFAETDKGRQEISMYISCFFGGLSKIFFNIKDYDTAAKYIIEDFKYRPFVSSFYYAGHMMFKELGMNKDIEQAIELLTVVADTENDDEDLEYIVNSNYDLGMIYATEAGYKNKQKSISRLNRAKELGYAITDTEISQITDAVVDDVKPASSSSDVSPKKSGCYVATCVYGSYDCPEVWTLRRFRDDFLAENVFGRMFIKTYYAISPTVVKLFGKQTWFHKLFKSPLDKLVNKLLNMGVDNTPYNDK